MARQTARYRAQAAPTGGIMIRRSPWNQERQKAEQVTGDIIHTYRTERRRRRGRCGPETPCENVTIQEKTKLFAESGLNPDRIRVRVRESAWSWEPRRSAHARSRSWREPCGPRPPVNVDKSTQNTRVKLKMSRSKVVFILNIFLIFKYFCQEIIKRTNVFFLYLNVNKVQTVN